MSYHARRTDTTQAEIVAALRSVGWRVWIVGGAIDLAVNVGGEVYLVDAKSSARAPRTATQRRMVDDGWPVVFATTGQEAIDGITAMRREMGRA